ncbi:MAG: hypothetical protein Q7R70_05020 [Candidatus Diapherotrites archaeon]|nr:hypothetical protein [Candidatus Diapherotrites archaeon]
MSENFARLLLYTDQEVFAEKNSGKIRLLETEFNDEEIPEEALAKKAQEVWGVRPENLKLLCVLPKANSEFVHYYASRDWNGSFENCQVEEIVTVDFKEMTEFAEKNDILAAQVLEKIVLGKDFKKPSTIAASQAQRPINDDFEIIRPKQQKTEAHVPESTSDFEIIRAVPKGMGRKQQESTREGIDFEFLSRGGKKTEPGQKSNFLEPPTKTKKVQKSVFAP